MPKTAKRSQSDFYGILLDVIATALRRGAQIEEVLQEREVIVSNVGAGPPQKRPGPGFTLTVKFDYPAEANDGGG